MSLTSKWLSFLVKILVFVIINEKRINALVFYKREPVKIIKISLKISFLHMMLKLNP